MCYSRIKNLEKIFTNWDIRGQRIGSGVWVLFSIFFLPMSLRVSQKPREHSENNKRGLLWYNRELEQASKEVSRFNPKKDNSPCAYIPLLV